MFARKYCPTGKTRYIYEKWQQNLRFTQENTDRVKNQSDCRIFTVPSKKKKNEHISCRPIQIWQGKTVQKIHFRVRNLSYVWVNGLPFPCNLVHKVLTSALITQIYRQNLLH